MGHTPILVVTIDNKMIFLPKHLISALNPFTLYCVKNYFNEKNRQL